MGERSSFRVVHLGFGFMWREFELNFSVVKTQSGWFRGRKMDDLIGKKPALSEVGLVWLSRVNKGN